MRRVGLVGRLVAGWPLHSFALVPAFAGCGDDDGGGGVTQLATPTFSVLEIPDPSDGTGWSTFTTNNPPAQVLPPTRGRGVRLFFSAPIGSSAFSVSLREVATATLPAVTTPLTQNYGTLAPAGAGYFEILSANLNSDPAIYHMYVRAPAALTTNPANYDILVVNQSLRNDRTDSAAMVVPLRARKITGVVVTVTGNGHVTSNPAGIQCGTSYSGFPLTDCAYEFGIGQVTLNPNTNQDFDPNTPATTRFLEWAGNCAGTQPCVLNIDGTGRNAVTATFVASSSSATGSGFPAAPTVPGWRWIGNPQCDPVAVPTGGSVLRDAQGYVCCSTGSGQATQRCSGQRQTDVDCRNHSNLGINARLIQPGGCYEPDSGP